VYFDARAAKLLKPGEHLIIDGAPGLRLVATDTRRTWTYRYKNHAGLMKQVKLGSWPEMSVSVAAAKWQELRARRDAGEDVAKKKVVQATHDDGYTLGQMIEDYASGYLDKRREPKGAKAVHQRLVNALADHGELPAKAVSRRFVFDLIESLSDRPMLAGSIKTEMGAAWDYALDAGRIPDELPNWWRLVVARKLRSKGAVRDGKHRGTTKRVLSDKEIKTLLNHDLSRFSQQVQDFLIIQLWTCTRGGEIVQMHSDQISDESDGVWWTMPKSMTKGAHREAATDLRVPLIGRALEIVQRLRGADQSGNLSHGSQGKSLIGKENSQSTTWLFPSVSRQGVTGHQVQAYMGSKVNYLQPYCKSRPDHVRERLTVTHWSPHDLRRTGRTMLAALGCPNEIGESILGHVQPGVIGIYNLHAYDKERRHWLTALSDCLEGLA
jgi:integrase